MSMTPKTPDSKGVKPRASTFLNSGERDESEDRTEEDAPLPLKKPDEMGGGIFGMLMQLIMMLIGGGFSGGLKQAEGDQDQFENNLKEIDKPKPPGKVTAALTAASSLFLGGKGGDFSRLGSEAEKYAAYAAVVDKYEGRGKNPHTSASGKYQFLDDTWVNTCRDNAPECRNMNRDQILALKEKDDAFKDKMFVAFTMKNEKYLTAHLGHKPSHRELYLAHQQGAAGAVALINHPGMKAIDVLADVQIQAGRSSDKAYKRAEQALIHNSGDVDMTCQQFMNRKVKRFDNLASKGGINPDALASGPQVPHRTTVS